MVMVVGGGGGGVLSGMVLSKRIISQGYFVLEPCSLCLK